MLTRVPNVALLTSPVVRSCVKGIRCVCGRLAPTHNDVAMILASDTVRPMPLRLRCHCGAVWLRAGDPFRRELVLLPAGGSK